MYTTATLRFALRTTASHHPAARAGHRHQTRPCRKSSVPGNKPRNRHGARATVASSESRHFDRTTAALIEHPGSRTCRPGLLGYVELEAVWARVRASALGRVPAASGVRTKSLISASVRVNVAMMHTPIINNPLGGGACVSRGEGLGARAMEGGKEGVVAVVVVMAGLG